MYEQEITIEETVKPLAVLNTLLWLLFYYYYVQNSCYSNTADHKTLRKTKYVWEDSQTSRYTQSQINKL